MTSNLTQTVNGYDIIASLPGRDDNGRFILCDRGERAAHQFVTWFQSADGYCHWGHYIDDRSEALADLIERSK